MRPPLHLAFTVEEVELIQFALQMGHLSQYIQPHTRVAIETLHNRLAPLVAKAKDGEKKDRIFFCVTEHCRQFVTGPGQQCSQCGEERSLDS